MPENIAFYILNSLVENPLKVVLEDESTALSGIDVLESVAATATSWQEKNLCTGDFVVVVCERGISFWIDLLSAWVLGVKPICIEPHPEVEHFKNILEISETKFWAGGSSEAPNSVGCLLPLSTIIKKNSDDKVSFDRVEKILDAIPNTPINDQLAAIIFTSGSTGLPKAVPLNHDALIKNALSTSRRLNLRQTDKLMIATPYRFISSISHFLVTLLSGASFFGTERRIIIKDFLDLLNRNKITAFGGSPFHVQFIGIAGQNKLPRLRLIMSSGDHLREDTITTILKSFPGIALHVVYGMAELAGRLCMLPPQSLSKYPGSVGFPIDGLRVRVLDEKLRPCGPNIIGDLYISGPLSFKGYLKNDDENTKVLTSYGFKNGDKGYKNEDGYLFISGRSDSVFKRSGLKVSSQVIVDALLGIEEISDAWVGPVEDQLEGQIPVAYITPALENTYDKKFFLTKLRRLLPVNHLPEEIYAVSGIPRTGSGKVDRKKLLSLTSTAKKFLFFSMIRQKPA